MVKNKPPKILLVEDDEFARCIALKHLNELGCLVDVADTGYGALDIITNNDDYDLILMDLGIFDLDGLNVTKKIREMKSAAKDIPIVAVTVYLHASVRKHAMVAGVDAFITKPFTLKHCQEALEKFVYEKRQ